MVLREPGEVTSQAALDLEIPEGQVVAIMETKDSFRDLLTYAFTQNLGIISSPEWYKSDG